MNPARAVQIIFYALALTCAAGVVFSWDNVFNTQDSLIGIGAALTLVHAGANPEIILKPLQQNTLMNGKLVLVGKFGLLFLIIGLVEVSGALKASPVGI